MTLRDRSKAAVCGEPSYVWRAGQERRLGMILSATREQQKGCMLDNGCGIGTYIGHLKPHFRAIVGLEYDHERAQDARQQSSAIVNAAGEELPFQPASFDAILSHEVLEHVRDDRRAVEEMIRVLKPGGVIALFVPNRGYPVETHGVYWRGRYHFGNIPLVHYLPRAWQKRLVPHVRAYSVHDLEKVFSHLPVKILHRTIIFGAYDNIIIRFPTLGRLLRSFLQKLEQTPLKVFGLSQFWVVQKL